MTGKKKMNSAGAIAAAILVLACIATPCSAQSITRTKTVRTYCAIHGAWFEGVHSCSPPVYGPTEPGHGTRLNTEDERRLRELRELQRKAKKQEADEQRRFRNARNNIVRMQPVPYAGPRSTARDFHLGGTDFFGIWANANTSELAVSLHSPESRTIGTPIASESLARAVAILAPVAAGTATLSREDIRFLVDQAGLAMVGADLKVTVAVDTRDLGIGSRDMANFQGMAEEIQDTLLRVHDTMSQRTSLEYEYQRAISRSDADGRAQLLQEYRALLEVENALRKELKIQQEGFKTAVGHAADRRKINTILEGRTP